jgi:hypothetical protein
MFLLLISLGAGFHEGGTTDVVSCPLNLQSFEKVLPSRVHLFNEFYLSGPVPCFQLPFPLSGIYLPREIMLRIKIFNFISQDSPREIMLRIKIFDLFHRVNAVELLEPNELVSIVPCREGIGIFFGFMCAYPAFQVRSNAGIKNLVMGVCCDVSPGFHFSAGKYN